MCLMTRLRLPNQPRALSTLLAQSTINTSQLEKNSLVTSDGASRSLLLLLNDRLCLNLYRLANTKRKLDPRSKSFNELLMSHGM